MKKTNYLIVTLFLVVNIVAPSVAQESMISQSSIEKNVRFLASEDLKGRMPGTPGYQKAAQYIEKQLAEMGVEKLSKLESYRNNVPLKRVVFAKSDHFTIKSSGRADIYIPGSEELMVTSAGKAAQFNGKPVFVGYGISEPEEGWNDLDDLDLKGKAVIILAGAPGKKDAEGKLTEEKRQFYASGRGQQQKLQKLKEAGAAIVLSIADKRMTARWQFIYHIINTRMVKENTYTRIDDLSVVTMHPEFSKRLFAEESWQPDDKAAPYKTFELAQTTLELKLTPEVESFDSPNIVAAVVGTDPELQNEWIVIGAHLDHVGVTNNKIYPGAVDNATGCAVVLEAARALSNKPVKRSVAFVFYTAEESGLIGSTWFVNEGPLKDEKIILNINIDEAGKLNQGLRDVSVIGSDRKDPSLKDLLLKVEKDLEDIKLDFSLDKTMPEDRYALSDHYPYHAKGIPAVVFYNGPYMENHMPEDTIELVDFQLTYKFARLAYAFAVAVAER